MTYMNIENCPVCGKVYAKNPWGMCLNCRRQVEEEYGKCVEYLREHRFCTLSELSEATGVSVRQITRFIREGRLSIVDNPNISYACDSCGAPIREGTLCESCRAKLAEQFSHLQADEQSAKHRGRRSSTVEFKISDRFRNKRF